MNDRMVASELVKVAKILTSASNQALMAKLKRDLKITWVKDGDEWGSPRGNPVLWSGEGAYITVDGEKIAAFDYYGDEALYTFGVAKELDKWAKKNGLMWEPYDAGTYLAYKA
jgi:hypothetical protein